MAGEIIRGGNGRPIQLQAKRQGMTQARRKTFLDALASSANVKFAAQIAEVSTTGVYELRRRDATFAQLWEQAMAIGYDRLEQALLDRAGMGANEVEVAGDVPVIVDGGKGLNPYRATRMVDGRVEMDVKLAQWLLERHDRTVRGGGAVLSQKLPTREKTEARLVRKLESLAKRGRLET